MNDSEMGRLTGVLHPRQFQGTTKSLDVQGERTSTKQLWSYSQGAKT